MGKGHLFIPIYVLFLLFQRAKGKPQSRGKKLTLIEQLLCDKLIHEYQLTYPITKSMSFYYNSNFTKEETEFKQVKYPRHMTPRK